MAQMWNLDPVPAGYRTVMQKLANGRRHARKEPNMWQLEIVAGANKGQHEMNKGKTGYLQYSSLSAAVRGMTKHGQLLDLCDACETPGTDDDPLADFYSPCAQHVGQEHGEYMMAHEECGKVNGWTLA